MLLLVAVLPICFNLVNLYDNKKLAVFSSKPASTSIFARSPVSLGKESLFFGETIHAFNTRRIEELGKDFLVRGPHHFEGR